MKNEKFSSRAYVLDMYGDWADEYDKVVQGEYKKVDHLTVPKWLLEHISDERHAEIRVLDLGCGTGLSAVAFFESELPRCEVVGVDMVPEMVAKAGELHDFSSLHCQSVEDPYPFDDCSFDAATMLGVWEFIGRPAAVAAEVHRVVRPGGLWGISVPLEVPAQVEKDLGVQTYAAGAIEGVVQAAGWELVCSDTIHGYTLEYSTGNLTVQYAASLWKRL